MELEGIMLGEICWKRQLLYGLAYMWNLEKLNSQKRRVEWWYPEARKWGKQGNTGQRVKSSSYKFWRLSVQHGNFGYIFAKRVNLKCSYQEKKELCEVIELLTGFIVIIIS